MTADAYEQGFCRMHFDGDGGYTSIPLQEWDRLRAQWRTSRETVKAPVIFETDDLFGAQIEIDLRDILMISRCTPESMERYEAHEEGERMREKAKRLIDGDS